MDSTSTLRTIFMPDLKTHCDECQRRLGEPFTEVHEWLDEFMYTVGPLHRAIRHNESGVEEARKRWGDKAAEAAKLHIAQDEAEFATAHIIGGPKPLSREEKIQTIVAVLHLEEQNMSDGYEYYCDNGYKAGGVEKYLEKVANEILTAIGEPKI